MPILGNIVEPTTPYKPPTYPAKYTSVQVPGRPGYLYDSNGNVVKDPCLGPPKHPYDTNDAKSTAGAPSAASRVEDQVKNAGGDGSSVTPAPAPATQVPISETLLAPDEQGNLVSVQSAPADASNSYDNANRDGNELDAYSTVGQSSNPVIPPVNPAGPGTTPAAAAADYPKTATPAAIQAAKDNLTAGGVYGTPATPSQYPGVFAE